MTTFKARMVVLATTCILAGALQAQTPPVTITECSFSTTRNAHLAWTNGATNYTGIQLAIDGIAAPESPLPGTATYYDSAQLGPGNHTFTVRPFVGMAYASAQSCTAAAELPAPVDLTCEAVPDAWAVHLSWTNRWVYSSVTIMRDGYLVTTLAGAPRTFTDSIPAPGLCHYEVHGTLSGFDSAAAVCEVESHFVPALTITSAEFSAARVATLVWANAAANYEGIYLEIDGTPAAQSPLPGAMQRYDSAPLDPGPHVFTLRPHIGIYEAASTQATIVSPLPPPSRLHCAAAANAWTIDLTWTNDWTYDSLVLTRDGQPLTTLAGDAGSYHDTLAGPGLHAYAIHAVLNDQPSLVASCSADNTYVPAIGLDPCSIGADRIARLSWTNGTGTYSGIRLFIDGAPAPQSPLPGATTMFESAPLVPGTHTFTLRPFIDAYMAPPSECGVTAILPEPVDLTCVVVPTTWRAEVRWTNGWTYDQVAIVRNGVPLTTLDGAATSYDDNVPALGDYAYEVVGLRGAQNSAAAQCAVQITVIPPVTSLGCDIDLDRIAHLAWTNGDARYQGVDILIDGAAAADSPLPPDATSYDSAALTPGPHTFAVRPFAGATTAEPATCAAEAPPPPLESLTCGETDPFWHVEITWNNAYAYEMVHVTRNGADLDPLPGDAVMLIDAVPGPGTYVYELHAVLGTRESAHVACSVDISFVPPLELSACTLGDDRIARLAWQNGAENYTGIEVRIDGALAPESPLAGDARAYESLPLVPGAHTLSLRPYIGEFQADPVTCGGTAILPAPTAFACTPSDVRWEVLLSWTAGWSYGSITIMRDGLPVATLPGAPESYVDPVPGIGAYSYEVYGSLGTMLSQIAACATTVSTVPPVVIDSCEFDAERRAHVAWTNMLPNYDGIEILIDGTMTSDSPLPGSAGSYDSAVVGAGAHTVAVRAILGAERSRDAACSALAPLPPPADLHCAASTGAWAVDLTWTNAWTYDSVTILRNNVAVATLPGSPTSYRDEVPALGAYAYVVAGNLGPQSADGIGCVVRITFVPAPRDLACTTTGMRAHLTWTNPLTYDGLQVLRDGEIIGTPPATTTSFDDTLGDMDAHTYAVVGLLGMHTSANAVCIVQATDVTFMRGDVNADGLTNIADAISLLNYLFRSGREPTCMESANVNDDGAVNIADVIYTLGYMFRSDQAPKAPFPQCGPDPAGGSSLGCRSFAPCGR